MKTTMWTALTMALLLALHDGRLSIDMPSGQAQLADTHVAGVQDRYMDELNHAAELLEAHRITIWVIGSHGVDAILVPRDDAPAAVKLLKEAQRTDGRLVHVLIRLQKHDRLLPSN
ncbi:MAG: hypothetical protein ACHQ50_12885 [Fimbriimonadales bacterium]